MCTFLADCQYIFTLIYYHSDYCRRSVSQLQLQGPSRLCKASVNAVSNKKYAEPLRHGLQAVYYDIHVSTHSLLLRLLSDSCSGSRECSKFPVEEHLCSSSAECTSENTSSKCMSAIFKHTFYLPYHEA